MFLSAEPLGKWVESRERDLISAWASYFKRTNHLTSDDERLHDCRALHNAMLEILYGEGTEIDGVGLAFIPEDYVQRHLEAGELVRVLEDWTPPFPGYHLYYPSRRQQSPAFALLVEALRYRN